MTTSESDSDNSLTHDLDQIGRLNLNAITAYINKDSLLNLPGLPSIELKNFTKIQEVPSEISRYVSEYAASIGDVTNGDHILNSIKTAVSTRMQMNNFLHDLDLGLSFSTAIGRLQPLTDVIHEAITLPAEDVSDFEDYSSAEERTEPVGVGSIVDRFQPLLNEIVVPEEQTEPRYKQKKHHKTRTPEVFSDDTTGSDLENIEGLSYDEAKALTHLDSLDDFYKEDLLRQKIQTIQSHGHLSQHLKNKLVTRLMMGNYYKYINDRLKSDNIQLLPKPSKEVLTIAPTENQQTEDAIMEEDEESGDEVFITEKDHQISYHNPPVNTIMGCQHYQTNCKVECPTCFKWFPCRFCHDSEILDHKLVRADIKHILCMHCQVPQVPENNYCINCENELANYFCEKCKLYDNDHTKDIYHCDKCGICRLGLGLGKDYFHCDECNICLSIDLKERHKCLTNTTHCNCPVCNEYLFTSVQKVVFMKCGHLIHQSCYDELSKHSYKCPLCKKTVVNVETQFRILDQEIIQLPLPLPYNLWRCIIGCNDCKGKSNVAYHVLGLKCKYCHSYNTNQLKLIKPEEEEKEEQIQSLEHAENRINNMSLIQNSLLNNFQIGEQSFAEEPEYDGDGDDNDEEGDDNERSYNIAGLKRLTNTLLGNLPGVAANDISTSSITSVFQAFINNINGALEDDNMSDVSGHFGGL